MSEFGFGLTDAALRAYDALHDRKKLPSNKRVLLESLLDKSKEPITENALRPAELDALNNLIRAKYTDLAKPVNQYKSYIDLTLAQHDSAKKANRKEGRINSDYEKRLRADSAIINDYLKGELTPEFLDLAHGKNDYERHVALRQAGIGTGKDTPFSIKPSIQYEDYEKFVNPDHSRTILSGENPYDSLGTLLGRFNYALDPKSKQFIVTDKYDFNPPRSLFTGTETKYSTPYAEDLATSPEGVGTGGGPYDVLRRYAGSVLPPGQGRDVRIQLNNLASPIKNALMK
jgi:hypothetical protein